LHIALAHSYYTTPGGEERAIELQKQLLTANGDQVWCLSDDVKSMQTTSRLSKIAVAGRMVWSRSAARAMSALIAKHNIDLVHVHNLYPALSPSVVAAARYMGRPVVMSLHNYRLRCPNALFLRQGQVCTRCAGGNYLHAIAGRCRGSVAESVAYSTVLGVHRLMRLLERQVSAFVSPSRFLADVMVRFGLPASKMHVIPHFVYQSATAWQCGDYAAYVGRLSAEKGVDMLIAAFKRMPERQLVIAGRGPNENELREMAADASNIRFVGYLDGSQAVTNLLQHAAFCIIPSQVYENQPYAAVEALAAGVPLLVSDQGGLPELVKPGENGLVFAAGDVNHLQQQIAAMWVSDLAHMSQAAQAIYLRQHTPQVHYQQLMQLYTSLV
jgi:glycosyltransferase involved in cell wall biosynthesis